MSFILPTLPKAVASYEPFVKIDNHIYISGQLPFEDGQIANSSIGRMGENLSVEDGVRVAKACTLNMLAQLNHACGGDASNVKLDKVQQCIKLTIFVNSAVDFTDQPLIANGASELILEILGKEKGKHARSAVGVYQLPKGVAVEVEGIFTIQ